MLLCAIKKIPKISSLTEGCLTWWSKWGMDNLRLMKEYLISLCERHIVTCVPAVSYSVV